MLSLAFPPIDPVAFSLGPIDVRWYALSYVVGMLLAWRWYRALAPKWGIDPIHYDDFLTWAVIGVILGGRLGYVLFYNLPQYLAHPAEILQVWRGGMSFHGGLMGVVVAAIWFCRARKINLLAFGDPLAAAAPIGLFLGRIANFVNGELYGRVTDAPWGVVFPHGGPLPRHPSQLYEAAFEGVGLFVLLNLLARLPSFKEKPGRLLGVFLLGYALARAGMEFFREPDVQIGFLWGGVTMGQVLAAPMIVVGLWLMGRRHAPRSA
ncbi:MAG: prolipoprotein diacylglyceryl transferase [Alphaproteobacteria bacterium]|nr:MAG: prolipoprotein diacylglyceryl transferase [Alphaproteobacteria bacterium]